MSKDHHELGRWRPSALLTRPIPVWAAVAAVAAVAVLGVALAVARASSVELGPAVGTAERVEIDMTLCNEDVDRLDLNPRHVELDLEEVLQMEGARAVDVRVERRDCPRPG